MGDLTSNDDVEDFCRLTFSLLSQLSTFPKPPFCPCPLGLLDDLDSLNRYNWGAEVYRFFVDTLNRVSPRVNEGTNCDMLYNAGCTTLLQVQLGYLY